MNNKIEFKTTSHEPMRAGLIPVNQAFMGRLALKTSENTLFLRTFSGIVELLNANQTWDIYTLTKDDAVVYGYWPVVVTFVVEDEKS